MTGIPATGKAKYESAFVFADAPTGKASPFGADSKGVEIDAFRKSQTFGHFPPPARKYERACGFDRRECPNVWTFAIFNFSAIIVMTIFHRFQSPISTILSWGIFNALSCFFVTFWRKNRKEKAVAIELLNFFLGGKLKVTAALCNFSDRKAVAICLAET